MLQPRAREEGRERRASGADPATCSEVENASSATLSSAFELHRCHQHWEPSRQQRKPHGGAEKGFRQSIAVRTMGCGSCRTRVTEAFYYRSVKMVEIRNCKLGLLHRVLQLAIVAYVIGYVIVYQQGYQTQSRMVSSFVSKVKGTAFSQATNSSALVVYDAYDLVQPPLEQGGLFVALALATTPAQRRSRCLGNYAGQGPDSELCNSTMGCAKGRATRNGVTAGTCDDASGFCYIYAWCPLEAPDAQLQYVEPQGVADFTVFISACRRGRGRGLLQWLTRGRGQRSVFGLWNCAGQRRPFAARFL